MVHSFTGFIKIKSGSLTVAVINMLLFSIFTKIHPKNIMCFANTVAW